MSFGRRMKVHESSGYLTGPPSTRPIVQAGHPGLGPAVGKEASEPALWALMDSATPVSPAQALSGVVLSFWV